MNRKDDTKNKLCSSRSKLDLKMTRVTRLPAKKKIQVCLGGARKRKELDRDEDDEKDTRPSMLDSLPLDLKMAILTRVPGNSLMNVKRVSKMYSSIIQSQRFIKSFSSMSSTKSRFIVAMSNGMSGKPEEKLTFLFSFSDEGGEDSSSLVPNFEMAIPSFTFLDQYSSCQSVHGILAVTTYGSLFLCNPSTEQAIVLPFSSLRFLGYDPIHDQYKLFSLRSSSGIHNIPEEHKVLTLGGGQGWRRIQVDFEYTVFGSEGICINGFIYLSAYSPKQPLNPGMVCFDVRYEKLSYIKAPQAVLRGFGVHPSIFIEYKGKLAAIREYSSNPSQSFDFWILEDIETHQWSHQKCVFPLSVWDSFGPNNRMCFPGTNKYGELILAPMYLSVNVKPFYIFYYNVETKIIRRVRLLGIGDDQEFLRTYGFFNNDVRHVRIATHHIDSIVTFKDPPTLLRDS